MTNAPSTYARVIMTKTIPDVQYAIDARVSFTTADGWSSTADLPTFYLDSRVQGITSADHAVNIARGMLAEVLWAGGGREGAELHISAFPVHTPRD